MSFGGGNIYRNNRQTGQKVTRILEHSTGSLVAADIQTKFEQNKLDKMWSTPLDQHIT